MRTISVWITAAHLLAPLPSRVADLIVTDGDTIKLNGRSYKLDGIDSPERDQVCLDEKREPWACGTEARDRLANHIGTRAVRCEDKGPDVRYG
jgi:endonuclease YncB( thermonuclease family)